MSKYLIQAFYRADGVLRASSSTGERAIWARQLQQGEAIARALDARPHRSMGPPTARPTLDDRRGACRRRDGASCSGGASAVVLGKHGPVPSEVRGGKSHRSVLISRSTMSARGVSTLERLLCLSLFSGCSVLLKITHRLRGPRANRERLRLPSTPCVQLVNLLG